MSFENHIIFGLNPPEIQKSQKKTRVPKNEILQGCLRLTCPISKLYMTKCCTFRKGIFVGLVQEPQILGYKFCLLRYHNSQRNRRQNQQLSRRRRWCNGQKQHLRVKISQPKQNQRWNQTSLVQWVELAPLVREIVVSIPSQTLQSANFPLLWVMWGTTCESHILQMQTLFTDRSLEMKPLQLYGRCVWCNIIYWDLIARVWNMRTICLQEILLLHRMPL